MDDHLSWDDVVLLLDERKAMAWGLLRRERHASLQTTALVVSALRRQRLADQDWECVTWANRQYFFGALYRAMERVVLDHARVRARPAPGIPIPLRVSCAEESPLPSTAETFVPPPAHHPGVVCLYPVRGTKRAGLPLGAAKSLKIRWDE